MRIGAEALVETSAGADRLSIIRSWVTLGSRPIAPTGCANEGPSALGRGRPVPTSFDQSPTNTPAARKTVSNIAFADRTGDEADGRCCVSIPLVTLLCLLT